MATQTAAVLEEEAEKITYTIPPRTISGSAPQLLEEIDDMIDALRLVREAIEKRAPKPARPPGPRGWGRRVIGALRSRK